MIPLLLVASLGCAPSLAPTWTEDIRPLMSSRCTSCHQQGNIGPFALQTYEEVLQWLEPSVQAVEDGVMPPWDAAPVREYRGDPSLTADEIGTLRAWADAGAPYGDESDQAPAQPLALATLEQADVTLQMPLPFPADPDVPDEYRCFAMPWPGESAWVDGFEAVPGNLGMVHHLVAFVVPPWLAETADGFAADDGRPGYPCFGGASMDGWEPADLTETFVASIAGTWVPGATADDHPGSGQWIEAGSRIVLQAHYHPSWHPSGAPEGQSDQTTLRFRTVAEVERISAAVAFLDFLWLLAPETMAIPPGEAGVHHAYRASVGQSPGLAVIAPELDPAAPMRLDAVLPHMHRLGTRIEVAYHPEGGPEGSPEPVVEIPEYDFDWQRTYELTQPILLQPEDELSVDCWFDNTEQRRASVGAEPVEPVEVGWGEGTDDEMCVALLRVSQAREEGR
jgi:hypothetical protein